MKNIPAIFSILIFLASPVYAIDFGADLFLTHKSVTDTSGNKTEGTEVDRFRINMSHQFNSEWSFKGKFEFKAGANDSTTPADASKNTKGLVYIKQAEFIGSGIFRVDDSFSMGVMYVPYTLTSQALGNRWITKSLSDFEGFGVASGQAGMSYTMKFDAFKINFFTLAAETGDNTDSDDNDKFNGAYFEYAVNKSILLYGQVATYNKATVGTHSVAANAKSTNIINSGINYKSDFVDAQFNYETANYTADTGGTADKPNMVMGANAGFKKVGGSTVNLFVQYWTGYDRFADTGEETESKYLVGPYWYLAGDILKMGIFYESEQFQADYKTANPAKVEPNTTYLKMAAKF